MPSGIVLSDHWFARSAEEVAKDLLGQYLCCRWREEIQRYIITEVEAYLGPHDLACHAAKGRTKRTEVMYGPAGCFYVYLIYGRYEMLNVVTGSTGHPAAVLIRAVNGISGPGRLTQALKIDRALNGLPARQSTGLWFEKSGQPVSPKLIVSQSRIGVGYAGEWATKKLRFSLRLVNGAK